MNNVSIAKIPIVAMTKEDQEIMRLWDDQGWGAKRPSELFETNVDGKRVFRSTKSLWRFIHRCEEAGYLERKEISHKHVYYLLTDELKQVEKVEKRVNDSLQAFRLRAEKISQLQDPKMQKLEALSFMFDISEGLIIGLEQYAIYVKERGTQAAREILATQVIAWSVIMRELWAKYRAPIRNAFFEYRNIVNSLRKPKTLEFFMDQLDLA